MSHTVKVRVGINSIKSLAAMVKRMGGTVISDDAEKWVPKSHKQYYGNRVPGLGFTLPGWAYPIVYDESGSFAYDAYRSSEKATFLTTDRKLDTGALLDEYALCRAEEACQANGLSCQRMGSTLTVFFDGGRTVEITKGGEIDAAGFAGAGCKDATEIFEAAIGRRIDQMVKPEMNQELNLAHLST